MSETNRPIYVLNDLFFKEIVVVLIRDCNGLLIYDPIYYELIDIFIGVCNIILNNVSYIEKHSIDTFFNSENSNLEYILSFNAYPNKYIELKTEENTNTKLYYQFFEQLKPKDLIELRFDQNNIYISILNIIKNICDN